MKSQEMTNCFKTGLTIRPIAAVFVLAMTLIAIAPDQVTGTTYYVDKNHPQASDSNPGTEALPWLTAKRAGDPLGTEVVAGDTVYFKNGTYDASGGTWTTAARSCWSTMGQPSR